MLNHVFGAVLDGGGLRWSSRRKRRSDCIDCVWLKKTHADWRSESLVSSADKIFFTIQDIDSNRYTHTDFEKITTEICFNSSQDAVRTRILWNINVKNYYLYPSNRRQRHLVGSLVQRLLPMDRAQDRILRGRKSWALYHGTLLLCSRARLSPGSSVSPARSGARTFG